MSGEQGSRYTGIRPAAIAAGRRQRLGLNRNDGTETGA
jgi:hypothetical protein